MPEKQRRWYVKHVEAFIKAQNGHKIKALSGVDIKAYLDVLGRENLLVGWQFLQRNTITWGQQPLATTLG
ncbi:MAG: hypothetical protein CVV05_19095 [Gammaproteobacteria bacterium HGW-Gammaproteobacteria-1]|nr:MAG: hypothetical protein CVV05_19095 [Gammaproteobacteria bacterium HGW-Gammaproteobacteria-1]